MHVRRQNELLQLIDDITLDINKLTLGGDLEYYDTSLISQVMKKLETLKPMQIGTIEVVPLIQSLVLSV